MFSLFILFSGLLGFTWFSMFVLLILFLMILLFLETNELRAETFQVFAQTLCLQYADHADQSEQLPGFTARGEQLEHVERFSMICLWLSCLSF